MNSPVALIVGAGTGISSAFAEALLADVLAKMDSVAEGVTTTKAVVELAGRYNVEMPITQAVHQILFDGKDCIHALTDLMTREAKPEAH